MDLLLINPGNRTAIYGQVGDAHCIAPPLGIAMIAAYARDKGWSVEILDAQADNLSPDHVGDLVAKKKPVLAGISACTPQMTAATEIIRSIRQKAPFVKTILGGHHPAALPERTLRETGVDFVCHTEGYLPTVELLEELRESATLEAFSSKGISYLRNGEDVVVNETPSLLADLDALPFAAWDLLPMGKYRAHNWHCLGCNSRAPYAVVFSSLGCPFNCSYCSVNAVYGKRSYRKRSPDHFVREIGVLATEYKVRHMEVVDDTFTVDKKRVHDICDLLIQQGHKLNLWAYARTDTVDIDLLKKMKKAGFNWLAYGFESGSETVRKGVNKGQDRIWEAVDMTRSAGIHIISNFIFGLPDDTRETMEDTLSLAKEINGEYANFWSAMAYPGSELYQKAVRENLRLPEAWHGFSQYAYETLPLSTEALSSREVLGFRDRAFSEYFSSIAYLKTIADKFGEEAVESIRKMAQKKLLRKHS